MTAASGRRGALDRARRRVGAARRPAGRVNRPTAPARRYVLFAASVVGTVVWIHRRGDYPGHVWWFVVAGLLALHAWLVHLEGRDPRLAPGAILAGTVGAATAAVVTRPYGSHDVYQYAMYGRMVAVHHANPYVALPAAFPHDPLFAHLSPVWHHTPTVYGPLFTGLSAALAWVYGTSASLAAHSFQAIEALALIGSVAYLWRRKAPTAALVFVGLSPVLLAAVNGAHNDLLAGALVLVGLDQARRDRPGRSAALLAAATSVKLLAAPAVVAVVAVLVVARRWRAAATFTARVVVLVAVGYGAVGGLAALKPLRGLDVHASRASLWGTMQAARLVPRGVRAGHPIVGLFVTGVISAVVLGLVLRSRHDAAVPAALAVALMACSVFAAVYVLPWYPASMLPAAGLVMASPVRRIAQFGSAALLVAYVTPPGMRPPRWLPASAVGHVCGVLLGVMVVMVVIAATTGGRPRRV